MADKRVQIGVGKLKLGLLRVTEIAVEEQLDSDIVKTFDEPVSVPSSEGGYKIDVSLIEARSLKDFKTLMKIIKQLKNETGVLSVYETVKHKEGNFETEKHFRGVSLSSNKVTFNAEDLTARDLSFNAEALREIVDNTEI